MARRITIKDVSKGLRTPESQEQMLVAARKLKDNPRAMEIYMSLLSGRQMEKLSGLMRAGVADKALQREIDTAIYKNEAVYGPKGIAWEKLRAGTAIKREGIERGELRAGIASQSRKDIGFANITSREDIAGLRRASDENIADLSLGPAYLEAGVSAVKGVRDYRDKQKVVAVQETGNELLREQLKETKRRNELFDLQAGLEEPKKERVTTPYVGSGPLSVRL